MTVRITCNYCGNHLDFKSVYEFDGSDIDCVDKHADESWLFSSLYDVCSKHCQDKLEKRS